MSNDFLQFLGSATQKNAASFSQFELLLLAYIHSQKKVSKSFLIDVIWPHVEDIKNKQKLASYYLNKLRKKLPNHVLITATHVELRNTDSDLSRLTKAAEAKKYKVVFKEYKGLFLEGIERNRRIKLSEELKIWLFETREEVQSRVIEASLQLAEASMKQNNFEKAKELALNAFELPKAISYPTPSDYKQMHTILLAVGAVEERTVREEAKDFMIEGFFSTQREALRSLLTGNSNLNLSTSIIGRNKDIDSLSKLLHEKKWRLINLVGIAGIGKTVVAKQLAVNTESLFTGMQFISLENQPSSSAEDLLLRIADAFGLKSNKMTAFKQLSWFIDTQSYLLTLDYFDLEVQHKHVLIQLVEACPNLRIIVTSQEQLNLEAVFTYKLKGLSYEAEALSEINSPNNTAYELLNHYLTAQGLQINESNFESAKQLIQLTQGHPLALQLLSSFAMQLSLNDIANQFTKQTNASNPLNSVHAALDKSFSFSFKQLNSSDKKALTALTVFAEEFDYEAAEAITNVAISTLMNLCSKSILTFNEHSKRYALPKLLKSYAQEKQTKITSTTYITYFFDRLNLIEQESSARAQVIKVLKPEIQDITQAWQLAAKNQQDKLISHSRALRILCDQSNQALTGIKLLNLINQKDPSVLVNLAWLQMKANLKDCEITAQKILSLKANTKDQTTVLTILLARAELRGAYKEALTYADKTLILNEAASAPTATALTNKAMILIRLGDYLTAETLLIEATAIFLNLARHDKLIWLNYIRVTLEDARQNHSRAYHLAVETLKEAEKLNLSNQVKNLSLMAGFSLIALSKSKEAEAFLEKLNEGSHWFNAKYHLLHSKILNQKGEQEKARVVITKAIKSMFLASDLSGMLGLLVEFCSLFPLDSKRESVVHFLMREDIYQLLSEKYKVLLTQSASLLQAAPRDEERHLLDVAPLNFALWLLN